MEKCFLFLFALLFSITGVAQDSLIRCNTNADLNWMQTNDPDRYQRFIDIETFTANYINNQNPAGRLINGNGLIIIPVVVHVLHYGEAEGTGYNISMATVQSQIDVLNEDFRRLNTDAVNTPALFQPVASDFGIEFRLACIDPNGNPTNGVVRKQTATSPFVPVKGLNNSFDENAMGIKTFPNGSLPWPTEKYLNIWVCKIKGLAGYATFPADFAAYPQFDGVVLDKGAFGRIGGTVSGYDKGRAATHEIGHWLNLFHLWGNTIGPQYNSNCSSDDNVGDTPMQKYPNDNHCRTFPEPIYLCNPADESTMFMNYMDYVPDNCYNLFTNGQKLRARALFASGGPRSAMLENYFKIQVPANTLYCNGGVIKLFNPNCITPVWSVVSGPATITSGQNTNACTLVPTGTGTVVLRATAGNYIDEKNISVSTSLPAVSISGPLSVCKNQPSTFLVNMPENASITWSTNPFLPMVFPSPNSVMVIPGGTSASSYVLTASIGLCNTTITTQANVVFNNSALPYTCTQVGNGVCTVNVPLCISQYNAERGYFLPNPFLPGVVQWKWEAFGGKFRNGTTLQYTTPSSSPEYITPDYGSGACVVYIRPVNNCGIVTTEGEPFKFIIINTSQPCYNYRYIVSPNPATNIISVTTDISTEDKTGEKKQAVGFTNIEIRNKMGNLIKKLNYAKGTITGTIDISLLPADVYLIRIYNGNVVEDHKVIITK